MDSYARIRKETLTIPTYETGREEAYPVFYELRNYQNAKGDVYPYSITEHISHTVTDKEYQAIVLENEYIRVTVLPQLGGRVYEGYDKINDYHFVYKNKVIKPALIGLCGPWISGGIEFNWPQHHRPSTFMPVDCTIRENEDGSVTAWMGEVEAKDNTKGMTGVTVYPDRSYIEVKVRLFNGTEEIKNFHWWSNLGVHINDSYRLIFPPDIDYITYHYKESVSEFPMVKGEFGRVDFGKGTDIRWIKNIPAPSSFFTLGTDYDFMAGYDEERQMGTVHVADRFISPGKKFFTWGNGEMGEAWQKNLTDGEDPYIEIMTGCYTDNQPDFAWLLPFESKSFEQYWYPIRDMGGLKNAGKRGAVGMEADEGHVIVTFQTTEAVREAAYIVRYKDQVLGTGTHDFEPGNTFRFSVETDNGSSLHGLCAVLRDQYGEEIISYEEGAGFFKGKVKPEPHKPALLPADIASVEELYLEGLHIEQYRHPTLRPEDYYQEGLKRDEKNSLCSNAMGIIAFERGEYDKAEMYFRTAQERVTMYNPNPQNAQPLYNLGRLMRLQGKRKEALDLFQKAAWSFAWTSASMLLSAKTEMENKNWKQAEKYIGRSLEQNPNNPEGWFLKAVILRKTGRDSEADEICARNGYGKEESGDLLYSGFYFERYLLNRNRDFLEEFKEISADISASSGRQALTYLDCGCAEEALEAVNRCGAEYGMKYYIQAYAMHLLKNEDEAAKALEKAKKCGVFEIRPNSKIEEKILLWADTTGNVPQAAYNLGCMYYAKGSWERAVNLWEKAAACWKGDGNTEKVPGVLYRNLGIAYAQKCNDWNTAGYYMQKAWKLDSSHPRMLYEYYLYLKASGEAVEKRIQLLQKREELTVSRDDLYVEYVSLLNLAGRYEEAVQKLLHHSFRTYEGGEGLLPGQYMLACIGCGRQAAMQGRYEASLDWYLESLHYPDNFCEGRKYGAREGQARWHIARAYEKLGQQNKALEWDIKNAESKPDMDESEYYRGLSLRALGLHKKASDAYTELVENGRKLLFSDKKFSYFEAFPTGVPFHQDMKKLLLLKAWCALYYGYKGLGCKEETEVCLKELKKLSIDLPWIRLIETQEELGYDNI